ncbi:hypothetical protein [Nocardia sp. CA-119907]|uniref:hypothetical protein n=1 Tax=Nocardia sp. CA-119907 TaxID=3239973 RepID=UPI003D95F9DB
MACQEGDKTRALRVCAIAVGPPIVLAVLQAATRTGLELSRNPISLLGSAAAMSENGHRLRRI